MIPIHDLLNKLKWDKKIKADEYSLGYYDRVEDVLKEVKYNEINEIKDNLIVLTIENKEVSIPLHRIKMVKRNGIAVWKREV